jgi:YidC/Oxa1 family membrane protein insertase
MLVFVAFLTYQERQYSEIALEAEKQASTLAEEPTSLLDSASVDQSALTIERPLGGPLVGDRPDALVPSAAPARPIPIVKKILQNENVIAEISNEPGLISSWKLRDFMERKPDGEVPIALVSSAHPVVRTVVMGIAGADFQNSRFEVVHATDREVLQRAENAAGVLTRRIRLDEQGYGFDLEMSFESRRVDPVEVGFEFVWPAVVSERRDFLEQALVAYGEEEGVERSLLPGIGKSFFSSSPDGIEHIEGRSSWAGADIRYFVSVLIDADPRGGFEVEFEGSEDRESGEARMRLPSVAIGSGGSIHNSIRGFVGPKVVEDLVNAGSGLEHSVDRGYSWIEPLVRLFEIALDKLYIVIPNYGLAIIVLTMLVRLVVSPLMVRQMRSAEKMRAVQPKVKVLQEKFKDDKQKQSEEMMKLWKKEGVNPLGGCLPLLLQFPVLIGLFFSLRSSIGLRHAPFMLWIDDLSQPATLFILPGLDFPIRILPLIMAGSMYAQQKMMPASGMDPVQAKMMLVMMPGMMLLFSYTFPSGLVLYWTVSNLLGIAQQLWIRKQMQPAT